MGVDDGRAMERNDAEMKDARGMGGGMGQVK